MKVIPTRQKMFAIRLLEPMGVVLIDSKRPGKVSRLSDKMNDKMTALNQRLRRLRGE